MKRLIVLFYSSCMVLLLMTACNDGEMGENAASSAPWETGLALYSFHQHPFATALRMADSADLKNIEGFSFYKLGGEFGETTMGSLDDSQLQALKRELDSKNMSLTSMYVEGGKDAAGWSRYFEIVKALGGTYLVAEPLKSEWNVIDSLAGLYNMKIAIHQHAREISAYWHPDSVLAAVEGRPNLGACADLGHWVRSGLDPVDCLKKLEGHIVGIHFKDVDADGNDVDPGKGLISFAAVADELDRQGYSGVLSIECEHNMENNLADVKFAADYINEMNKALLKRR